MDQAAFRGLWLKNRAYMSQIYNVLVKTLIAGGRQFQKTVILFGCNVVVEVVDGIDRIAIAMHLIVTVGTRALAGAADPADDLAALDLVTRLHLYPEHMTK